jgi:hypothetical protein
LTVKTLGLGLDLGPKEGRNRLRDVSCDLEPRATKPVLRRLERTDALAELCGRRLLGGREESLLSLAELR